MEYARAQKDYDSFVGHAKDYTKGYAWNNWNTLNSIAWGMYENEEHASKPYLGFAKKIAKRSIRLDRNSYNTDTYAAVLYKSGKYKKALKWADEAITLARTADLDYSVTSELIKKIKSEM